MAKYDVTRACGHVEEVQISGPHRDRDWKLAREAQSLCDSCWASERKKASAKAAEAAQAAGLPELRGSERQISWAESLRARIVEDLDDAERKLEQLTEQRGGVDSLSSQDARERLGYLAAFRWLRSRDEASFWIDHRGQSARILLKYALEQGELDIPDA